MHAHKDTQIIKLLNIKTVIYFGGGHRHSTNSSLQKSTDRRNKLYPLECIFSKMEIASIAMHATISMDILK